MGDPLFKPDYVNLPITMPAAWRDSIDRNRSVLGLSRNAALCLCIKVGAVVLEKQALILRRTVIAEASRLDKISENLGAAQSEPAGAIPGGHERARKARKHGRR
jgi:hypothetical protein